MSLLLDRKGSQSHPPTRHHHTSLPFSENNEQESSISPLFQFVGEGSQLFDQDKSSVIHEDFINVCGKRRRKPRSCSFHMCLFVWR